MFFKRILSFFLLFALSASVMCACGIITLRDPYATEGTTALPGTDTHQRPDDVPVIGPTEEDPNHQYTSIDYTPVIKKYIKSIDTVVYDDLGFFIVTPSGAELSVESEGDTALSKATYQRNQLVEKTLGVRLFFQFADSETMIEELKKAESSGFYYADLIAFPSYDTGAFVSSNTLLNLRSVLYLDLTADYFNESSVRAASAGIYTYAIAGAATLDIDSLPALYFNRKLLDTAALSLPYDQVYDGEWTWDILFQLSASFTDEELTPLLTGNLSERLSSAVFTSLGGRAVRCGIKETPHLTLSDTALDQLTILGNCLSLTTAYAPEAEADPSAAELFFDGGTALFFLDTLAESVGHGTSSTQWGLLPLPKMNREQESYLTPVTSDALLFAVPRTTGEIAATGRVLSVFNAASYGVFVGLEADARLETAFRDNDSAAMFVKVTEGATYDFLNVLGTMQPSLSGDVSALLAEGAKDPGNFPLLFQSRIADLESAFTALFPASD